MLRERFLDSSTLATGGLRLSTAHARFTQQRPWTSHLVPRLLNAGQVLEPAARVALTAQLMTSPDGPDLDLSAIEATPDDLLAELLRAKLIEDSEATFAHFAAASWPSVGPALRVSSNAARFITPGLVAGKAAELVRDRRIPVMTRRALLDRLVVMSRDVVA